MTLTPVWAPTTPGLSSPFFSFLSLERTSSKEKRKKRETNPNDALLKHHHNPFTRRSLHSLLHRRIRLPQHLRYPDSRYLGPRFPVFYPQEQQCSQASCTPPCQSNHTRPGFRVQLAPVQSHSLAVCSFYPRREHASV
jgi:hypothetical protein